MRTLIGAMTLLAALQNPTTVPPARGFRAELLRDLDDMQKKITDLAAAMPADKYTWRPASGVRSVSEVFMHIAGGNYYGATFVGVKAPVYDERAFERIQDKERVLAELKKSFQHLRMAILTTSDADLDKPIKMFGNDSTEREAFMFALFHLHEHLGQSIAYARMNGVVPPWSASP
ncbi:MAG: damage-inducible protein DinB [Acidobacteria bacterium]|nr:MAG: damage-inducible protein DinB [Acidobacteriota bacterium]